MTEEVAEKLTCVSISCHSNNYFKFPPSDLNSFLWGNFFFFSAAPVSQIVLYVGPGHYEVHESDTRGGLMTTRQQRFQSQKSETPGPGSYEVKQKNKIKNGLTGEKCFFPFWQGTATNQRNVNREASRVCGKALGVLFNTPSVCLLVCLSCQGLH